MERFFATAMTNQIPAMYLSYICAHLKKNSSTDQKGLILKKTNILETIDVWQIFKLWLYLKAKKTVVQCILLILQFVFQVFKKKIKKKIEMQYLLVF